MKNYLKQNLAGRSITEKSPENQASVRKDGPYGAFKVARSYAMVNATTRDPNGYWQHGWVPHYCLVSPSLMFGFTISDQDTARRLWVARVDEASFLKELGFHHARAIGLPILYLKSARTERCPGSLLVMPMHSLEYTRHAWNFENYAETIQSIRRDFSRVTICVHESCWKNGYWVDSFRRRGFDVIRGANLRDADALTKMKCLFQKHEFVTTNGVGSHLPYAAYYGAKPSIYGEFASFKEEDFASDPLYAECPDYLMRVIECYSQSISMRYLRQLFVSHPREAVECKNWANESLGADNILTPHALRVEFGWTRAQLLKWQMRLLLRSSRILRNVNRLLKTK